MTHPLVAQLASPDAAERRAACEAIAADPAAVLLVDALGAALADPDKAVARAASDALAAVGRRDPGVTPVLDAALRSPRPAARFWAAFTIARLGPPPIKLLPALLDALELPDGDQRFSAARVLVELGRLHGEVLPVLLHFVRSGERPGLRRMAVFALRALAPDRPESGDALARASREPDLALRRAALSACAALLEPTEAVWERLFEAAERDLDPVSRRTAAQAVALLAQRPTGARGLAWLRGAARAAGDPVVRAVASRATAPSGAAEG